jgi:phosphatidylglycerol:prolipoprotein diacylglycerol transferase
MVWTNILRGGLDALADRVVLFRCGNAVFVTFGLFAGLGALLSMTGMGGLLVAQGVPAHVFLLLALVGGAAVVVGSWLAGQLFGYELLLRSPREALRRPVFVSWGGLVGMLLALAVFAPFTGLGLLVILDAAARSVPLGHALGRFGCLSYGCCFGRPTRFPVAITYRNPEAKAVRVAGLQHVPLHPAAFYEAVLDFGILVVVNAASWLGVAPGVPTALTFLLYGLGRFAIEFLRDDRERFAPRPLAVLPALSVNHLLCLAMAAVGALALPALLRCDAAPFVSWPAALAAVPTLLPITAPSAGLVFLGFSLHRGRVGKW